MSDGEEARGVLGELGRHDERIDPRQVEHRHVGSRGVDEGVDPAAVGGDLVDDGGDPTEVAQVEPVRRTTLGAGASVGHRDARASPTQHLGDDRSQTAVAAHDQGDPGALGEVGLALGAVEVRAHVSITPRL